MRVKKQLGAVIIILITLISFAACSKAPSYSNLIANGNFVTYDENDVLVEDYVTSVAWEKNEKGVYESKAQDIGKRCVIPVYANNKYKTARWSETFPEGWKVRTSDPAIATLASFEYGEREDEANAVTFIIDASAYKTGGVTPAGCGWIQIYQKVKVNPHTNYTVSFDYKGSMSKPNSTLGEAKVNNAVGVGVGFLEDPSYVAVGSVNSNLPFYRTSFEKYTSPVFNSGSLRHLTVCISVGAPDHDIGDSKISIRKISMTEEVTGTAAHTIYKNGGYKDTNAAAIIIAVAAFVLLAALCFFITYFVNKNYVYSKVKDDDGIKFKAKPGKGNRKADLAADKGDSTEVPLSGGEGAAAPENVAGTENDAGENGGQAADSAGESAAYSEDIGFDDGAAREKRVKKIKEPGKFGLFMRSKVLPAVKTAWAKQPFLIMLGLALVLRIICVFAFRGYRPGIDGALAAIPRILTDGVKYYSMNGVDYAPGQLYIFYYLGLFQRWFSLTDGGAGTVFFLKLPTLIADLGIGYIIYSFTRKFVNKKTALGVSALYLFNPAVLFAFEIWGGTQAVWLFFLALALLYMLDRKYLKMCAAYAGAVLFSESALAVAPLLAVYLVAVFIKAVSAYSRRNEAEKKAPEGLLALPKYSAIWKAPAAVLLFFVSLFLLCLPLTAAGIDSNGFGLFSFCSVFQKLALDFNFHTNNGFNVAAFMGRNGPLFTDVSDTALILFYFLMCALLAGVYIMKRNRANLLLLSSFLYLFTAYFMANASPLTAVPALVILLLACVAVGDRRLYGQYFILSAVCLLNISSVMISAQYMNNLPGYLLNTATNTAYGGKALLPQWFMIAGTVIAVLGMLYFLVVAMDIAVANRRKVFMPFDPENPHYALDTFKSLFR